jgi:hypothetical protein
MVYRHKRLHCLALRISFLSDILKSMKWLRRDIQSNIFGTRTYVIQLLLIVQQFSCELRSVLVQSVVFVMFGIPNTKNDQSDVMRYMYMSNCRDIYPFMVLFVLPLCALLSELCNFSNVFAVLT